MTCGNPGMHFKNVMPLRFGLQVTETDNLQIKLAAGQNREKLDSNLSQTEQRIVWAHEKQNCGQSQGDLWSISKDLNAPVTNSELKAHGNVDTRGNLIPDYQ